MKKASLAWVQIFTLCFCFLSVNTFSYSPDIQNKAGSPEERIKSWEQHQQLRQKSPFNDLKWRAVGPEFQGGRIEAIACSPDKPFTMYVGAGAGNLWKTVNNGITWEPIFEHESTFSIGSIVIAPSDPDIVWVGTGEILMARSSFAGTGVFKSTDAGKTWTNMGLHDSHHVPRVLIDPQDPNVVYVAALGHNYGYNEERGLFKTTDGGKTWEKILYISEKVGIVEVVLDPADNQTLYAAAWERDRKAWNNIITGEGSGLYKTTDGGRNWKRLTNGLPTGKHIGRFGLAVSTAFPKVVYALVDNHTPREEGRRRYRGEVYRSEDKGETWHKTHEGEVPTGIGYDFCLIRIAPDNVDEIFICGQKLIRSQDGGKTFEPTGETIVHLLPHDIRVMHLDMHELWIDPKNPDRLLLGNDGGVYCSYDRGDTWLHLNNLPIGEFYAISVDMAEPYNIYGGTQDNAALFGPITHNLADRLTKYGVDDPWQHVYLDRWGGGDSYFTELDPTDPDTIYYEHQFGELRRKNIKTGATKSIKPTAGKGEPPLRRNWMTPYIISYYNPRTLYYGSHKVFKSPDRGDSWTCISPDLSTDPGPEKQGNVPFGTITSLSESVLNQGLIYAGTDDGNIQVTQDDGKHWTLINSGIPPKWVSRVVASRHEPGTVYVSLTGYREDDFEKYLYLSPDFGQTWRSIAGNLTAESINVMREDPQDKNILYVGTDLGVYVSLDRGQNWFSLCNNLPTTPVHDIAIHPRENEMVIGTHGRSCFVLDVKPIQKRNKRTAARQQDNLIIPEVERDKVICFALYTVHDNTMKMTAQLYPLQENEDTFVRLQVNQNGRWQDIARADVTQPGWTAHFRVDNWDAAIDIEYRLRHGKNASYTGRIRKDPVNKETIVVAAFTGNSIYAGHGGDIPKSDIVENLKNINPDLLFFSGDQVYDHNRHLAYWLKFGRDFGAVIRNTPTVTIPDDHDVGQGNLWGAEGKRSYVSGGSDGGYIKPVVYVKEVEKAQTSHLPDPYDSTSIQRGIGVYYTSLTLGRVSFAIIEDRKFKSGPKGLVPQQGPRPDHILNPDYDPGSVDVPGAKLLGDRQLKFLEHWAAGWKDIDMKAVLSQTIFCGGAHIHGKTGGRLHADMDSNGWPQTGRNKALAKIRKAFAVHIAGDQHLGTIFHHGINDWEDAGYSFCVPSIANLYLRWWGPLKPGQNRLSHMPEYTGRFLDGFGNRVTCLAAANPSQEPNGGDKLTTRAAGFGVVRFNKKSREITFECWPRNVDTTHPQAKQYPGWPKTIQQADNYDKQPAAFLPTLNFTNTDNPVVQIIDESDNQIVYTLRIKGRTYKPKVFHKGTYTIKVGKDTTEKTWTAVKATRLDETKTINIKL